MAHIARKCPKLCTAAESSVHRFFVNIPHATMAAARRVAQAENRPVGAVVRRALARYCEEHAEPPQTDSIPPKA
jgi:hypothetical protein